MTRASPPCEPPCQRLPDSLRQREAWVLHDPRSYIDAAWLAAAGVPAVLPPRLANHLLLAWLATSPAAVHWPGRTARSAGPEPRIAADDRHPAGRVPEASTLAMCLLHWEAIDRIAYLLGAHGRRDALIRDGRLPFLRWGAAAFLQLPVLRACASETDGTTDAALFGCGASLLHWALADAPVAYHSRLCLRLPPDATCVDSQGPPPTSQTLDQARFLLKLAIAHSTSHV